MSTVALKTAAKTGYPRRQAARRLVGGLGGGRRFLQATPPRATSARRSPRQRHRLPGDAGHQDQGLRREARATSRIRRGSATSCTRAASSTACIVVEALRVAQAKYGKGKVMTPEQLRWGFEHLNLTEARIKELGAAGLFPPIKTSCADHEGSGMVKFQRWDGTGFKQVDAVHGRRPRRWCARWSRRPPPSTPRRRRSRRAIARRKAERSRRRPAIPLSPGDAPRAIADGSAPAAGRVP